MPSQFFGLNIAYTGLQAANAALNTTGNNISNVETKGYTRQTVNQTAADALRTNTTYGMAGAGVSTNSIDQERNKYYDLKYWRNNSDLGTFEIKQLYMRQIEDYFTETKDKRGFGTIYNDMFSGLEEVYKNPGDDTKKSAYLALAGDLCEYFGALSEDLEKLQLDANSEIKNRVEQINNIGEQIATLNQQINAIEIMGPRANELRDKRNLLVDELSKIVNVEVVETPIYATGSNGQNEESGINNYLVKIAGGQVLTNGYDHNTIECVARTNKVNQSDADGLYDLKWSNNTDFNMYGNDFEGELKGLIEIRDGNLEENFKGNLATVTGSNTAADPYKITVDVSEDYLTDFDKCALNDTGTIKIGMTEYEYTGWTANGHQEGDSFVVDSYTFALKDDAAKTNPSAYIGKKASIGVPINYQGVPYYMNQMNEWTRKFAHAMNSIERTAEDVNGNAAESLFTAKSATDSSEYSFEKSHTAGTTQISDSDDSYYKLTAESFRVNSDMINDVNKFGTTADISLGADAQDITEKLMEVKTDKEKMTYRGCTSGEFLQTILSDVALAASNANTFYKNYSNISSAIQNQRLSVSGVDNDEEALNLVKFQEAYNLSAKMMQVMTEIYDRLILSTGV